TNQNAGAHFVIKLPLLEQGNVMNSRTLGETHD
ncbi:MAG: two-component system sensor histidine kinase FlrB, partial [Colwellia sp.]